MQQKTEFSAEVLNDKFQQLENSLFEILKKFNPYQYKKTIIELNSEKNKKDNF